MRVNLYIMAPRITCVHLVCPSNILSDENRGKLFCFPRNDTLRYQWLFNMDRLDLLKLTYQQILDRGYRVCKLHFQDNQFQTTEKKKLNFGQVPYPVLSIVLSRGSAPQALRKDSVH